MCVSLPAQVTSLADDTAVVSIGASQHVVGRRLLPEARPGDWVLIYAGQMVEAISPEEAGAITELLHEVANYLGDAPDCEGLRERSPHDLT